MGTDDNCHGPRQSSGGGRHGDSRHLLLRDDLPGPGRTRGRLRVLPQMRGHRVRAVSLADDLGPPRRWGCLKALGVVLGLCVLACLLLPALDSGVRPAARRAQCVNNLKQIGLALHNYESVHGCFPPVATFDARGRPLLSWRVLLLPYMEEAPLYEEFHLDERWDSPHNWPLLARMPNLYGCPSDLNRPVSATGYQVVVGPRTLFPWGSVGVKLADVTDGTSRTIAVVESTRPVEWSAPIDITDDLSVDQMALGSQHEGGYNVLFADGAVRFMKTTRTTANPAELQAMFTRNGGEPVDQP